ncbi:hypothetical protein H4582DRAFT_2054072 [Lactarius indigo]|nr:hypothetical protein H4582DRAFT_2054072 [Lactarius indigo]
MSIHARMLVSHRGDIPRMLSATATKTLSAATNPAGAPASITPAPSLSTPASEPTMVTHGSWSLLARREGDLDALIGWVQVPVAVGKETRMLEIRGYYANELEAELESFVSRRGLNVTSSTEEATNAGTRTTRLSGRCSAVSAHKPQGVKLEARLISLHEKKGPEIDFLDKVLNQYLGYETEN